MEVARFARDVVQIDLSAVVIWAGPIKDEKRRDQTVRSIAETWARVDVQKAESWPHQNSYSEEWIEKVMEKVQKAFGLRPRLAHQSQKVPMKESSDVFFAKSTFGQHSVEPL